LKGIDPLPFLAGDMKRLGKSRKRIIIGFIAGFFVMSGAPVFTARANADPEATLTLPVGVLERLIQEALPMEIEPTEGFTGQWWVRTVEKLYLGKNSVSFRIRVQGKDVSYSRKIAGYPAVMRFGEVDLTFNCTAAFSYDRKRRILYIKPQIRPAQKADELLTPLLMAIVNESEFPVEMETLKPVTIPVGSAFMTVHSDISSIATADNRMMIGIVPRIQKAATK